MFFFLLFFCFVLWLFFFVGVGWDNDVVIWDDGFDREKKEEEEEGKKKNIY